MQDAPPLCPSATLDGAPLDAAPDGFGLRITGLVGADGTVSNLRTPLPVDAAMRGALRGDDAPERRFRFAAPCAAQGCGHWQAGGSGEASGQCGLIGRIRDHVAASGAAPDAPPGLQPCAIRARCRWWQQDGAAACAVCTLVTYNAAEA
jgi:hypothetical protein